MKKRAELLKTINGLRTEVMNLLGAKDLDGAAAKSKELDEALNELNTLADEKPVDNGNLKPLSNLGGSEMFKTKNKDLSKINVAVNQYIRRGTTGMDAEAMQIVKPINATDSPGQVESVANRGGVLVPVETADYVLTERTGTYRLRDLVSEHKPIRPTGTIPMLANPQGGLVAQFDEFPASGISRSDIKFSALPYSVKDYGLIIPVSNDLVMDASVDVFAYVMEQFNRAQRMTENSFILTAIDGLTAGHEVIMTDWKDLNKALISVHPIGSRDKVIITNSDGVSYLDTLTDNSGRPFLTQAMVDDPRLTYRGYEVIQMSDNELPTGTPAEGHDYGAIPFIVGNLYDAVVFVERQGLEVMSNPFSDSAFSKNATDIRVTCRLDCVGKWANSVKKLLYTPADDE